MEESEDNISSEDINSSNSRIPIKKKSKKRSLIERELETNLTLRVTSPVTNGDGANISRYGRARRHKSKTDQSSVVKDISEIKSPKSSLLEKSSPPEKSPARVLNQSPVYKMHASNSPLKIIKKNKAEKVVDNQIETIYQENMSLSRFSNEDDNSATPSPGKKIAKLYVRKDLIQKREPEDTVMVIQNMFSPVKSGKKSSSTHLNNILERSCEKYSLNNKQTNANIDNSSVVKTLDFDSKKKKDTNVSLPKNELFEIEAKCAYQVGDLAWARMGTYPFWPSIITREPSSGLFVKRKLFGRIQRDVIHVTFFGDNGRRGWIVDNMLQKYLGREEFESTRDKFTPQEKKKDPRLYAAYFVTEKKKALWDVSVGEAEMLLKEPKRLRIDIFNDMLVKSRSGRAKQPKSKVSRTDSDVSLSESLYDSLFSEDDGKTDNTDKSRNKSRKKSFDMFEVVTACLDNMAAKTGITKIQRQSHMDRWLQKAKSKTPEKTKSQLHVVVDKVEEKKEMMFNNLEDKKPQLKTTVNKIYSLRRKTEAQNLVVNENGHHNNINTQEDNVDIGIDNDHTFSQDVNDLDIKSEVESLTENNKPDIENVNTTVESETFTDDSNDLIQNSLELENKTEDLSSTNIKESENLSNTNLCNDINKKDCEEIINNTSKCVNHEKNQISSKLITSNNDLNCVTLNSNLNKESNDSGNDTNTSCKSLGSHNKNSQNMINSTDTSEDLSTTSVHTKDSNKLSVDKGSDSFDLCHSSENKKKDTLINSREYQVSEDGKDINICKANDMECATSFSKINNTDGSGNSNILNNITSPEPKQKQSFTSMNKKVENYNESQNFNESHDLNNQNSTSLIQPEIIQSSHNLLNNDLCFSKEQPSNIVFSLSDENDDNFNIQSNRTKVQDQNIINDNSFKSDCTEWNVSNSMKNEDDVSSTPKFKQHDDVNVEEENNVDMSMDEDSDSEQLPYSPLSNLGNNSDDNLSLDDLPFDDHKSDSRMQNNENKTQPNLDIIYNGDLNLKTQEQLENIKLKEEKIKESDMASKEQQNINPNSNFDERPKFKLDNQQIDPFQNPNFVKYMERKRDEILDENPDVGEKELVAYMYKIWQYEEGLKPDAKKNEELRESNLVKGQTRPQSDAPPRKKNLSMKRKQQSVTNTGNLKMFLRRIKDTEIKGGGDEPNLQDESSICKNIDSNKDKSFNTKNSWHIMSGPDSHKHITGSDHGSEVSRITEKNNDILVEIKNKNAIKEESDVVQVNSNESEVSVNTRKKQLSGKKVEKSLEDPDFVKYLEMRQDSLIEEHPELTQDEILAYLYQTWLYEENTKSELKKTDEIEQSAMVKGVNEIVQQPKKVKRKITKTEKTEKEIEDDSPNKPKRKSVKPFYNEEYSDFEEELEVYEIFKPRHSQFIKDQNSSTTQSEPQKSEIEVYDEVELYFAELTKPKPNIFKGLLREKVCEICEKVGNLVKCKGCSNMFHIECVKKQTDIVEITNPTLRGRKKKKKLSPRLKNSEELGNESEENSVSIEEILETEPITVDADILEAQLSAKIKEILGNEDNMECESYSSDESPDWNESMPGKCEIVQIKLKPRQSVQEADCLDFKCNDCEKYNIPVCFVCKRAVSSKDSTKRQNCHVAHCHKYYHLECLDHWPQTQFSGGDSSKKTEHFESFTCPRHVCHTCVSDDPRGCKTRFSGDKLARCLRCPATYHSFTKCLPAGTQILTASHIICPRHHEHKAGKAPCHVNTGWCFICALGGSLICCEYCPTSFHAECLNIDPPEGGYMCEDCETGRLPLYGEMVWVKLGHYRWWPGIILHPYEIPENLLAVKHSPGEFVVRFFGQYDHYWVNRGRVFPFQEGDSGRVSSQKSKIDAAFTMAVEHAQRACQILKNAKPNEEESIDIASSLLPPYYVKLKVNKPRGSLCGRRPEDPESSLTQCECNPLDDEPCGPYSQCLNRMLLTECGPICRAGDRCNNRAFEKRLYPKLVPYRTPSRGWGLKTLENIKAGQFVIEYVGELIDEEEFRRRMDRKHEMRDENFYFLTLDKERMIDAGPKGNLARFMNHCCEPNCETQKWTVLGDVRVGLFALYDIPAQSEVTFNYNLECAGIDKKRCMCGAKRCSGYIGAKPKQEESQPKKNKLTGKRTYKKRKPEESPSTKNIKRPLGRPRKPKELTEIEKDLLIIKNATNGLSSDDSIQNHSTELDNQPKGLKRKRISHEGENGQSSSEYHNTKKTKLEDKVDV